MERERTSLVRSKEIHAKPNGMSLLHIPTSESHENMVQRHPNSSGGSQPDKVSFITSLSALDPSAKQATKKEGCRMDMMAITEQER